MLGRGMGLKSSDYTPGYTNGREDTKMIQGYLVASRVSYGKATTPIKDREYRCPQVGGSSVGSRKDWTDVAKQLGFTGVRFVELDKTEELVRV